MKEKSALLPSRNGKIFVISAPSGCGKTTLVNRLVSGDKRLCRSLSVTTRRRRPGESAGKDYSFVSRAKFMRLRKSNLLAEWAKVFDHYYGTPVQFLEEQVNSGYDVVLTIDVQGALKIKKKYPQAVLVFIMPPEINELRRRLEKRKGDSAREIRKRLKIAEKEISFLVEYDYFVINNVLKKALERLKSIIKAERSRIRATRKKI